MREATRDWIKAKEAISGAARREADPTNWANKRRNFLNDQRQKRIDDLASGREMEKQALANQGQLDVTDRSQIGETKRAGMREAGLAEQADKTRDMSMRRLGFDQEKEQTRFTESARDYGLEKKRMQLDKMFKDRKFTGDQKKSYLERLDKLTAPRLDPEGYPIEDTGMPYGKALEQMDFEERALKERRG